MIVACYVRVSTENQLENYSIEEQTERLKLYCKSKDYTIYDMYIDGGYSGGNMQRPALQKLLSDVQSGRINAVLVYKLDRLSRSQKDTLNIIEDHFLHLYPIRKGDDRDIVGVRPTGERSDHRTLYHGTDRPQQSRVLPRRPHRAHWI